MVGTGNSGGALHKSGAWRQPGSIATSFRPTTRCGAEDGRSRCAVRLPFSVERDGRIILQGIWDLYHLFRHITSIAFGFRNVHSMFSYVCIFSLKNVIDWRGVTQTENNNFIYFEIVPSEIQCHIFTKNLTIGFGFGITLRRPIGKRRYS